MWSFEHVDQFRNWVMLNLSSYWVSVATGANYPAMELIGPVLPEVFF